MSQQQQRESRTIKTIQAFIDKGGSLDELVYKWRALDVACVNGHDDILRYLVRLGLTIDHVRRENNRAIRWAAKFGHVYTVKYLVETFGLTKDDLRANDNYALRTAAKLHSLITVEYLIQRGGLDETDICEAIENKNVRQAAMQFLDAAAAN